MKTLLLPTNLFGFVLSAAVVAASFFSTTDFAVAGDRFVNGIQVVALGSKMSQRLDEADPVRGEKLFKRRCRSCHNSQQDSGNKTGPNLWDVVGRKLGSRDDFRYSTDMLTMNNHWGYEELDKFLTKPFKFVPSTRMTFPGFKKEKDRADVIAFLRTNSPDPLPLPSDW